MITAISIIVSIMIAAGVNTGFRGADSLMEMAEPWVVIFGDEQFDKYIPMLEGKRVALFSNHTGIVGDKNSGTFRTGTDPCSIPFGTGADGEEIIYGEHISVDEKTGVPILSLYSGGGHSLSREAMERFDILVADMQDVGLRYYTYYISLYYLMDACAAEGKEVLILDRPNPNGFYVDGPILEEEYKSGVGILPIPVVYGMTWGELAQMINGEGWLEAGQDACDLTVIPCRNYTHQTKTSLIRRPSPNLKDMRAVYLYASTCFFENTAVSVGRGTDHPFEIYGSPYLEEVDGFEFSFTPRSMEGASNPPFKGETCYGVDLREIPIGEIEGAGINLDYLIEAYNAVSEAAPDVDFWGRPDGGQYWIDKLSGSSLLRTMSEEGRSAKEIKDTWQEDLEAFKEQRRPYLLYKE